MMKGPKGGEIMNATSTATRELYHSLRSEVIGIDYRLRVFRKLFTAQETVDLLNREATRFFFTLRLDLLDTIVLAINRLLDPAKSLNIYDNASLQQLVDSPDRRNQKSLIAELKRTLAQVRAKSARLKNWRDKWVSHRDLEVLLGQAPKPVTSLVEFDEVLAELQAFMNKFESCFQDPAREHVFDGKGSSNEYALEVLEWERLKIEPPTDYANIYFIPDDTNIIIDLIKRANSPY
jgi:hypothetical protein